MGHGKGKYKIIIFPKEELSNRSDQGTNLNQVNILF